MTSQSGLGAGRSALRASGTAGAGTEAAGDRLTQVRVWLWAVALLILLMVVVGGATRLTESGLSITEWKPISGVIPPLTSEAWQAEFAKYRQIPQYATVFPDMDLAGFKSIFYWEWSHRLLGRVIGFAVAAPLVWFWLTGALSRRLKLRLVGLLLLGGLQGLIGWWMVKSGLVDRTEVSQYRLALHLLVASLTLALAVWYAESLRPARQVRLGASAPRIRATATLLLVGVFVQLGLGALVAGLRAGRIYNTWPSMGGHVAPPASELWFGTPWWRNIFENGTTAQFDHRMMAYLLLAAALLHAADCWRATKRDPAACGAAACGTAAWTALALALALTCQACIGIVTLLWVVPLGAALAHQAFATVVLATAVTHRCGLRRPAATLVRPVRPMDRRTA